MAEGEALGDLHGLVELRFQLSRDLEGRWQILQIAGYSPTDLVLRHDPATGERFVACPVLGEVPSRNALRWRANAMHADLVDRIAPDNATPHLLVRCTDARQHSMLNDVVAGLIRKGTHAPVDVIRDLRVLQRWWEPPREMSDESAVGLFGELYFLANWLDADWPSRIAAWDGPDKSLKDFNWPDLGLHVEVKTSQQMDRPLTHVISGVNQLDVPLGHHLALFSLGAKLDPSGAHSLSGLVDDIRQRLISYPFVEEEFVNKLGIVGYHPELPDFRFVVVDATASIYRVDDEFPRIVPGHFVGAGGLITLDERISIRAYAIRLQDLDRHRVDIEVPMAPAKLARVLAGLGTRAASRP